MTPDAAALRALADAATGGEWTDRYPFEVHAEFSDGKGCRVAGYVDSADAAYIAALRPDTVRALCDAADEVERLRKAVWATEEIDRRAGMLAGVEAERDASRTAHAALIADLRALHTVKHECSPAVFLLYTDVLSLLDRHAPEEGR